VNVLSRLVRRFVEGVKGKLAWSARFRFSGTRRPVTLTLWNENSPN
jgi:hypothetical protein